MALTTSQRDSHEACPVNGTGTGDWLISCILLSTAYGAAPIEEGFKPLSRD